MDKVDKGVKAGIVIAAAVTAAVVLVYLLAAMLFSMPAQAKPKWPFPEPPYIAVGLSYENGTSLCDTFKNDIFSHKIVSDIKLGQTVWKKGNFLIDFGYRHGSCAFHSDYRTYDGVGFQFIWKPWKK